MKFLRIFFTFLFFITIFNQALAIDPETFVQSTVNRASDVLSKDISKEKKMKELEVIAIDTVDIRGIGFYTLGGYKKNLSDDQKKEYSELFEKYFLKSFASRLAEYTNPQITVLSKEKLSEKYTIVSSVLVATEDRPEVKINWRIYTKNIEKPLIRDLIIEGLSLARTQKEEFSSIIESNNGNIDSLFSVLKDFIK